MVDVIINYVMSFIKGISIESWVLIALVFFGLFWVSKIVSTILRPIFQLVSITFMLFSIYKFATVMSWF